MILWQIFGISLQPFIPLTARMLKPHEQKKLYY